MDHLLTAHRSGLFLRRLQCNAVETFRTDHKLLLCNIVDSNSTPPSSCVQLTSKPGDSVRPKHSVDPSLLKGPDIQQKFQSRLSKMLPPSIPPTTVEDTWLALKVKVQDAAKDILSKTSSIPATPDCRRAFADVKKYSFWTSRSSHPKWVHKLSEARDILRAKIREHEENEIKLFFENLQKYPAGERINRTFQYLKRFNKKSRLIRGTALSIRLNDWVLDDGAQCLIPDALEESGDSVLPRAPTLREIEDIVGNMKNGKTPGVDAIYAEYFKYCDSETVQDLHQLLVKVWNENKIPTDWKRVIVVPIPKVRAPKTTGDYRKICLSCVAYKVYALRILQKLQNLLPAVGCHQAAFLPGRSTIDHLHVV